MLFYISYGSHKKKEQGHFGYSALKKCMNIIALNN